MPTLSLLATHLAAQSAFSHYWHKLTDRTFAGIYHANAFDLAMMIPYFIVLFVLAIYGLHRYWLVYDYFAYAKNVPPPPAPVVEWPRVTVQLPIFNERYVIERLVEALARFDYPRELLDVHYPQAEKIRMVQDNLNTHDGASLYEAFQPTEARRLLDKIEFHYTPKHGSWVNMAETEIGIMKGQCLDRRLDNQEKIATEVAAWEARRNAQEARIHWTFTLAVARQKLRKLYPSIED